ncbi:uncharacterized protein LOC122091467 [Macadamia integrifolia]|uniref:uncharacterized protein LOC122091467 n=1 Tax=Macadamia integrifolia TaxID=60698 RepID=UPI001C4F7405|nr:uncharacterized protein LOC122091467 [Macadamia integrifolia]
MNAEDAQQCNEMGDQRENLSSSEQSLDIETIRSRMKKLSEIHTSSKDISEMAPTDLEKLMEDCVLHLGNSMKQITSELLGFDSLGPEELDAYLENATEELKLVEAENAKISNELDVLTKIYIKDSTQLESDLDRLNHLLELIELQGLQKLQGNEHIGCSISEANKNIKAPEDYNIEIWELDHQIEKKKIALSTLQDLESIFRRVEANQQIEDTMTGLKIIDFEGNYIRLSLTTFIPISEDLACQQKMENSEPSRQEHELLIEVFDGTMELKNVEIFPNDVFIGELIDAAKSFRQFSSSFSLFEIRSSLEWFVREVQDRIRLCSLRRLVVKCANKSRHTFEYSDRDDTVTSHMVGGIDAFIKISQGWPLSNLPLKLISLKCSDHSKGISLSFFCKVEELVNNLDVNMRLNLSSFVDAIEEILLQQTRSNLECKHVCQQ